MKSMCSSPEQETQSLSQSYLKTNTLENTSQDFSYTIHELSHELGNIATLINSSLQIIETNHPEVKSFKHWDTTTEDVRYMISLLSQLSIFNNSDNLKLQRMNPSDLVKNTISSFSTNPLYKHIRFQLSISNNIPLIDGDCTKLKQVIINLLKNACEADPTVIHVRLCTTKNYLQIEIADNGYGIAPEHLPEIFQLMFTHKPNGTGLGLPICKRIIAAHHGDIMCESLLNHGTTFTIFLPL